MKNRTRTELRFFHFVQLALIPVATLLSACSQSAPSDGTTTATTAGIISGTTATGITSIGGYTVSECNLGTLPSTGMVVKLQDYYTTTNNTKSYSPSQVRAKIATLPAAFTNGSMAYFDFYTWQANADGSTSISSTPLTFTVINPNSGRVYGTFGSNKLDQAAWNQIVSANSLSGDLTSVELLIQGTALQYQVLRVALKQSVGSASDTVIDQTDILIPAFTANPTEYASTHVAVLNQLHPMLSLAGSGYSDGQFQQTLQGEACFRTVGQ